MFGGYMEKIININLEKKEYKVKPLESIVARKFIGGTGLASYFMSKYPIAELSPLDPQSPIIFTTGPLTGTNILTSGRFAVIAKSPLTGIWGESDCGGKWGIRLKAAGYDALIITGKSEKPVYLLISNEGIEFCDAGEFWGLDTYNVYSQLIDKYTNKASVLCIGPAGEKMISIANIMSEGYHGRAAGRCGLGAVMGAKNLKAIVTMGSLQPKIMHPDILRQSIKQVAPNILAKTKHLKNYGTAGGVIGNAVLGDMSAKNWTDGNWVQESERVSGEEMARKYVVQNYHCPTCIVGCGKSVRITRGQYKGTVAGGPEYETIAGFGAQLMIDDLEIIIEANDLCNRYGLDTISISGTVAFLFEACDKGLLEVPRGYPPLTWGNGNALIFLINETVKQKGLGRFIGNGVKWLSNYLGNSTEEFAMHVKGLELPYHDPRALSSLAVAYATHARGACHRGCSHNLERFPNPELGYPEVLDRHSTKGKGAAVARMQNYAELYNCLKLCQFIMSSVQVSDILKWVNCVTGWNMGLEEFLMVGERSINQKRMLNLSFGLTSSDDKNPVRILTQPFPEGLSKGFVPDLPAMLKDYYGERGWNESGIPTQERLAKLELI